jgi:hypothetical protein
MSTIQAAQTKEKKTTGKEEGKDTSVQPKD